MDLALEILTSMVVTSRDRIRGMENSLSFIEGEWQGLESKAAKFVHEHIVTIKTSLRAIEGKMVELLGQVEDERKRTGRPL